MQACRLADVLQTARWLSEHVQNPHSRCSTAVQLFWWCAAVVMCYTPKATLARHRPE